jgi:prolycopene isomerase
MQYDAIIIGAGVGGLSAALKLSNAGKKVLVIERQPMVGGFATMFTRRGFRFESSIHCVDALTSEGRVGKLLREFGIAKEIELIELPDFSRIVYPNHDFVADFNRTHFIEFLNKSFPREQNNISRLFAGLDKFYKQFSSFDNSQLPIALRIGLGFFRYKDFFKATMLTVDEFLSQYSQDEKLKGILTDIWKFLGSSPSKLSAFYYLIALRGYYLEPTAYIKGGFTRLFEVMVERIKKQGCQIRYNTTVTKIITEHCRAVKGVLTDKGEELTAKVIISDANALDTLTKLLDNEGIKKSYHDKLSRMEKSPSAFQVYLGLDVPTKSLGMNNFMLSVSTTYNQEDNYDYIINGDYDRCLLELVDHSKLDSSFAPAGKSTLTIITFDTYAHWKDIDGEEYKKRKIEMANKLIKRAEQYLPGLSRHIEVMEVATPKTMLRYTLSPEGAIYGFAQTVKQSGMNRLPAETEVKGLLLCGAWTQPGGGVHACFFSGVDSAGIALKLLR